MNKLYKWVATHQKLAFFLFSGIEIVGYSALFYLLNFPIWLIVLIDALLLFINYVFVLSCCEAVLKPSLDILDNQGDPMPLFDITQELLAHTPSGAIRQILLINHCVALGELGELQQAHDILAGINIDQYSGTAPTNKVVYYNNLAYYCDLLGDTVHAEIWYEKAMQIYNGLPENKQKQPLHAPMLSATADSHFRNGRYDEIFPLLEQIHTDNTKSKVENALMYAKIHLQQGEVEKARSRLRYVLFNGNKLYAVTVAKKLLDSLDT